mmetsp:Transcript_34163/g.47568  ORF Transcript_34163/g.47568 Transcript_34163/m.47568 type:complete len:319 (+) Transcript_34163:452-1408(+)
MNLESLCSIHPLKAFESIDRDFRSPSDKLHKIRLFLLGHIIDDLPEPLYQLRRRRYPLVLSVGLEVIHVDVREAAYEELELLFIEYREELGIYYLAKSLQKSIDLALDTLCQLLFRDELEVLILISICHLDVLAVVLQLVDDLLPEHRVLQGERHAQALAVNLVPADPLEAFVVRRIDGLDVRERGLHAQHVLVEGAREVRVEQLLVIDGLPDEAPDELEVVEVVRIDVRVRVWLEYIRVVRGGGEQAVPGVEDLARQEQEPLPGQPPSVHTGLTVEFDRDRPLQLLHAAVLDLVVRILEEEALPPHEDPQRRRVPVL